MIKIIYDPFKEIVIKEVVRYEKIDDLLYPLAQLRASGAPVALNWANGVVFVFNPIPTDTDQLIEEYVQGRMYWASVAFAIMPEYKPIVETKERAQVPVINGSSNHIFGQVAEWLKQQK